LHFGELTPPEQRVLGCLIEKRWTTPDQYPLSLNALRLACNQSTNRDPVTDYDESTVRVAAERLSRYGLARLASGHTSRAVKYRHLAEEALALGREELAVLAVLLLRGAQTPGELKARSERMAKIRSLAETESVLASLAERGYVRRLDRRPGQKEDRFEHLLGPGRSAAPDSAIATGEIGAAEPAPADSQASSPSYPIDVAAEDRASSVPVGESQGEVSALRDEVSALREEVSALRVELAALRVDLAAAGPAAGGISQPGGS